jgi:CRP-like cAMP-binding protein
LANPGERRVPPATPTGRPGTGSPVWYRKRRRLLKELDGRVRRQLRRRATTTRFQSGDLLFARDSTAGRLHLVLEGRVRLARFDSDGGETQVAVIEPGEAYREPPHAEVEAVDLMAEALGAGELMSLDLQDLAALVEEEPDAFSEFAGALIR